MNLYNVRIPRSIESTEWYVVAETAEDAMRLYVDGVVDEMVSVDEGELVETGSLYVDHVGRDASGAPRVINWGSSESITHDMRPITKSEIKLTDHPDWDRWRTHFADDGLVP